jgi:biotin operon repressor
LSPTRTTTESTTEYLSDAELAARLHIGRTHVHALRKQGLPSISLGRARRYDLAECVEWLREHGATVATTTAQRVAESRAAQNLPPVVEDHAVLARVASLLNGAAVE